jgi:predicted ATPase/class 3 adenylate cyclase
MDVLPSGTLTLLFSDVEGSTSMLTRLGAQWGKALSAQRTILRAAFEKYGGHEMGTEGDSFFVVFTSAQQGVLAAVEAQRGLARNEWPGDVQLRVRMGLHTGEPQRHEDGYIGLDVHRAARIMNTASGGQIVVSAATQALVEGAGALAASAAGDDEAADIGFRDLGLHRLKDIGAPEHLYDVRAPRLADQHPPLRSLGMAVNLPSYSSGLVGRESEMAELVEMICERGARLVTLIGPGGTGKTRLAVTVAGIQQTEFPGGVFFVPLHTVDRAALIWDSIAEAVGAPTDDEDVPPSERALRFLVGRRALLVLDNLEQVADADVVASRLLNEASGVTVLATSRRPLHLVDEHQYPVTALPVPSWRPGKSPEAARIGAVELFEQRARMVRPGFELTAHNVADVVTLCRRLDGLPLAIELAAARSRLLGPKALLERLDSWLGSGLAAVDRAERQRTLASTISWSYDLLEEPDRLVFRRLGVFSSRVGLDAVEQVVGVGRDDPRDPLDVVAHLVDVSLLEIVEGSDGEPMVFMLETIRRFARDLLEASGAPDEVRLRHAQWLERVTADIVDTLRSPRQMTARDRMEAVKDDVRAALDWTLSPEVAPGDPRRTCGFALLTHMDTYWYRFGYIAEGRGWHERAMRLIDSGSPMDDPGIVDALHGHGLLAVQRNDPTTGTASLRRALEMARRIGDLDREARESNSLGLALRAGGDDATGRDLILRSIELARQIGNRQREATALSNVVLLHMDAEDYDRAVVAAKEATEVDRALNDPWGVAINQLNLASALLHAEGPGPARALVGEIAHDVLALDDVELSIDMVETFAAIAASAGNAELAATLVGAADAKREGVGMPRVMSDDALLERFVGPARAAVGPERWEPAYRRGRSDSIEDAVARATSVAGVVRPDGHPGEAPPPGASVGQSTPYDAASMQQTP